MSTSRLLAWGPPVTALAAFVLLAVVAPARAGSGATWQLAADAASLVPFGDVAARAALAAAALGAFTAFFVARLVIATVAEPDAASAWGGVTAGALVAIGLAAGAGDPATVCAIAATALGVAHVAAGAGATGGLGLALAVGAGLACGTAYLAIVPVVGALWAVRLYRGARFPLAMPTVIAAVFGALHAGAVIRARGWVDPFDAIASPWPSVAGPLADALGPFGVIAAVAGLVALWRRPRTAWIAAAVTCAALTEPHVAACAAAGVGAAALVRLTGRFAAAAGLGVAMIVVMPAVVLVFG